MLVRNQESRTIYLSMHSLVAKTVSTRLSNRYNLAGSWGEEPTQSIPTGWVGSGWLTNQVRLGQVQVDLDGSHV